MLSTIAHPAQRPRQSRIPVTEGPDCRAPSEQDPWLVGDIGGTNARFALVSSPDGHLTHAHHLRSAGHENLADLIRYYLQIVSRPCPSLACIALAGPILGDRCRTTNAHLDFSIAETARSLGLRSLQVVNDFAATALAARDTPPHQQIQIGAPRPAAGLPIALLGPGTGLGAATLAPLPDGTHVVLSGEGGHAMLAAADDRELDLLRTARRVGTMLTAEMALSGPGLTRLYQLLHRLAGTPAAPLPPEEVCARALDDSDPVCVAALDTFCNLLGGVAANLALTTGARGGVYLTGGILPTIKDFLMRSDFRSRFENNPTMHHYLAEIATILITDTHIGLRGATAALREFVTGSAWEAASSSP